MQIEFRFLKERLIHFSEQLSYLDGVNFRLTAREICVKAGPKQNIIRVSAGPRQREIAFCIKCCYK